MCLSVGETMAETMMRRRRAGSWAAAAAFAPAAWAVVGLAACLLLLCAAPAGAELRPQLTVMGPFDKHDHKGSRIVPYFEKTQATNIMQSFIRVRPEIDRVEIFMYSGRQRVRRGSERAFA